jgi:hypothetical protein
MSFLVSPFLPIILAQSVCATKIREGTSLPALFLLPEALRARCRLAGDRRRLAERRRLGERVRRRRLADLEGEERAR